MVISGSGTERRAFETPYAVSVVDAAELRSDGPMVNLSESLSRVPGIVANLRNNYAQDLQLSSRGFGARATFGIRGLRLYTDGIPATMPDGQGQVSHFDIAGAQRIEVLRGPFSAMDSHFNGARLIVVGSMVRVKHGFSAAMGCSARLSACFGAGPDAKVATKIREGGVGVLGQVPMPPQAQVKEVDAQASARWILELKRTAVGLLTVRGPASVGEGPSRPLAQRRIKLPALPARESAMFHWNV